MCQVLINIDCINSVSDCLKTCSQFKSLIPNYINHFLTPDNIELSFFYRGESSRKYVSQPSLFRLHDCNIEHQLINEVILAKPDEFINYESDIFSAIVKMQHFGLPTRLLDISKNPLVSLWFACQKNNFSGTDQDGKFIFIAGYPCLPNSNRAKILSYFASNEYDHSINECNIDRICSLRDQLIRLGVSLPYSNNEIDINNLNIYYQSTICQDTIILPQYSNERIKMQQGAFIMFGNNSPIYPTKYVHSIEESDPNGFDFYYSISYIPHESKQKILSELNEIGINESYLFPDLEHTISSIKNKYGI